MAKLVWVSFLFFFLRFFLFSFAKDGSNSFLTAFLVFTADVLDQVASVHCICSCLSRGSGQEVMVSLPLTVISLSLGSRSRYTCSVLVAYFMKYFLLIFFLSVALSLLFSPRPGLDLDQSALVLDLLFSWSCRTLVLVVSWSHLRRSGLRHYDGWAKLKLAEFQNQRERESDISRNLRFHWNCLLCDTIRE